MNPGLIVAIFTFDFSNWHLAASNKCDAAILPDVYPALPGIPRDSANEVTPANVPPSPWNSIGINTSIAFSIPNTFTS